MSMQDVTIETSQVHAKLWRARKALWPRRGGNSHRNGPYGTVGITVAIRHAKNLNLCTSFCQGVRQVPICIEQSTCSS
jgi:hypothetical protein